MLWGWLLTALGATPVTFGDMPIAMVNSLCTFGKAASSATRISSIA